MSSEKKNGHSSLEKPRPLKESESLAAQKTIMSKKKSTMQKIKEVEKIAMAALKVIGGVLAGAIGLVKMVGELLESVKEIF